MIPGSEIIDSFTQKTRILAVLLDSSQYTHIYIYIYNRYNLNAMNNNTSSIVSLSFNIPL